MLRTQNKIKFSLRRSKLLKRAFFIIFSYSVFFTTANANLSNVRDQADISTKESSYFLDIDNLRLTDDLIVYTEKENPGTSWIVIPIKSSLRDYYKAVANVVAAELHKRIDKYSIVPHVKFLIGESMGDGRGYQLLGSVYKKDFSTTPILEIMKKRDFDDHTNVIYRDYAIEHNLGMWNYLGLPSSPDPAVLELSEDNKLVRYDYYNSFQYNNPEIHEKCFCTSYFPISDYNCSVEHIKTSEQELRYKHKETLEKIISEISIDSKKYLEGKDLHKVNQAVKDIMSHKF